MADGPRDDAVDAMLIHERIPFPGLLGPFEDRWERRHLELLAEQGFDDVRLAHNAVFVHLTLEGARLTHLADMAGMSKQAMAELVDDLVAKGYVRKEPDPSDGRAKLLVWTDRGTAAHEATMGVFAQIESEMAAILGRDRLEELRAMLVELVQAFG